MPLIKRAAELTGRGKITDFMMEVAHEASNRSSAASLRVIADHSRAATFLISDGVLPANEGRGYVLRKIIRRALTHGRLLGQTKPFLHQMVYAVRDLMQDAYPELNETADRVSKAILAEETRFAHTMSFGISQLEHEVARSRMDAVSNLLDELDEEKPEHKERIQSAFKKAINAGNNIELLFRDVERFFGKERAELFAKDWRAAENSRASVWEAGLQTFSKLTGCQEILLRTFAAIPEFPLTRLGSKPHWQMSASGRGLPGRARQSRRRIRLTSSFRNQNSKDIGRRARKAAKCWP